MKTSTKITIFLFFTLLGSFLIIPMISAQDSEYDIVQNDNFKFSITPDIDNGNTQVDQLPLGVSSFENLGMVSYDNETGVAVFKSKITMLVQANFYTDYLLSEAFKFPQQRTGYYTWLTTYTRDSWLWDWEKTTYDLEYFHYPYLKTVLGDWNIKARGFDTNFNIETEFVNYEEKFGITQYDETAKVRFSTPEIYPIRCGVVGSDVEYVDTFYEDKFVGIDGVVQVEISNIGECDNNQDIDYINSLGAVSTTPEQKTVQQQSVLPSTHKELQQVGDTFKIHLTNVPQITVFSQDLTINYATMYVDTKGADAGIISVNTAGTKTIRRDVGWRIENNNIQHTFEFTYLMYGDVTIDPELRDVLLEHPEFIKGDVVWDISLFGDTGASLVFTESYIDRIWNNMGAGVKTIIVIVIIIIIIGAVLFGTFYVLMKSGILQNMQNRKMMETMIKITQKKE